MSRNYTAYLQKAAPAQPLHNRLLLLWAAAKLPAAVGGAKQSIIDEALEKQHPTVPGRHCAWDRGRSMRGRRPPWPERIRYRGRLPSPCNRPVCRAPTEAEEGP